MSQWASHCPICGWRVDSEAGSVPWINQFHGLYSSPEKGIVLTGVGLYSPGLFIAPPDPSARWGDPGHGNSRQGYFDAMTEVDGKRAFVFHDACWSLVEQAYHPAAVPRERLFEVLNSLPAFARDSINWEHDYGGLGLFADEKDYFPWEYPYFADRGIEMGGTTTYTASTPLPSPPSRNLLLSTAGSSSGQDPFNLLPEELCCTIAAYLPTPDVLNARCASRSFWGVFDSQQFWASRFKGKISARSWLYEAAQDLESTGGIGRRDWRWLYHRTIDARLGQAARNRKRVWGLIRHVLPSELPFPWQSPSLPEEESPRPLLAISTVRLGRSVYIAGLSLTTTSGEVLRLGYRSASSESSLQLQGAALTGFNLAVNLGGIHDTQCVSGSGTIRQLSPWLGCPDDALRTERLSVMTIGRTMGLRMLSVAAVRQRGLQMPAGHSGKDNHSLRHSAIWYPDVPPPTLNLNQDFLVAPEAHTSGFKPLFWSWFGGPGGIYLASLVKVRITGEIGRIDFFFDTPEVPAGCQSFGRIEPWEDKDNNSDDDLKVVEFPIDGPGGEVIDSVEIRQEVRREDLVEWWNSEGYLTWLEIHTNRGRTLKVGSKSKARNGSVVKKRIAATPGTAITGFYGSHAW
ncbi:hypothetical protein C8A00DRAFT_41589 [Chaetomidium leptoderma]|uniref:F-box domain-containing protein n=1 Tax=Chaetomidium leptoderma TaxID=669021 RepID=A0AAN7A0L2_9PEZI|nr:hypothetical protein C8A00DRAFT_41589 [Chaetomidium leptoderma]